MPHKPATRALAVGSSLAVLILVVLGIITLIVLGTAARAERNSAILREVCEVVNRQNRVLRHFSELVNDPIPVPENADPALAEAIINRNAHLTEGAEYARRQTEPVDCTLRKRRGQGGQS